MPWDKIKSHQLQLHIIFNNNTMKRYNFITKYDKRKKKKKRETNQGTLSFRCNLFQFHGKRFGRVYSGRSLKIIKRASARSQNEIKHLNG